jgi:ATP-dependent DNA helicase RecQ
MSVVRARTCNRPNLKFSVRFVQDISDSVVATIASLVESGIGIVFVQYIYQIDVIINSISEKHPGISTAIYHSKLSDNVKLSNQQQFMNDEINVMICTTAFGMGVDKSNVRFVLHYGPCYSSLDYMQMAGRAGRDGRLSECITFTNNNDLKSILNFKCSEENEHQNEVAKDKLKKHQEVLKV